MTSRRNPFREIERMLEQLSHQFEESSEQWESDPFWMSSRSMESLNVDVAEKEGEFVVTADLPGFTKEDIDVRVSNDTLTIEARQETDEEEESENYIRRERKRQSTSRSVTLPDAVVADEVSARYNNGVITVRLPKAEPAEEGHSIEIE